MTRKAPHSVLPPGAIAALQKAAEVEPTKADPLARVKAVEQATRRIKLQYPHLFKEEHQHEDQAQ